MSGPIIHPFGGADDSLDQPKRLVLERVRFLGHQVKGERCSI